MIKELDLHGKRHHEVDGLIENFILLNEPPVMIITGNSEFMRARVKNMCRKHGITFDEMRTGTITILKW